MSTYEIDLFGSNGRPVRAKYGTKDINGSMLLNDPLIAAAVPVWLEQGGIDGDTVVVTVSAAPKLLPDEKGVYAVGSLKTIDRADAVRRARAA